MGRSSWKDPMRLRGSGQFHFCPAPRTRAQLLRVAMASKIRIEWAFDSFFIAQIQRLPAPRVRASDANATRAQVKRARFAFTIQHLEQELRSHAGSRAVCRSHDGRSGRSLALRPCLAAGLPWTE